jgi:hypothetical protein
MLALPLMFISAGRQSLVEQPKQKIHGAEVGAEVLPYQIHVGVNSYMYTPN